MVLFVAKKGELLYNKPAITFRYLWDPTAVKRVLTNEFYTGTLVCHIEETDKAKKIRKEIIVIDMENNELALVIVMNAPFGEYGEIFDDDGNVTLAHNGDYKPIPLKEVKN